MRWLGKSREQRETSSPLMDESLPPGEDTGPPLDEGDLPADTQPQPVPPAAEEPAEAPAQVQAEEAPDTQSGAATPRDREIQKLADRLYSGNAAIAFRHWSLGCLITDQEPTEEDLKRHVDLGEAGNLGIEGYWVDELNTRLILMQTKFSSLSNSFVDITTAQWFRTAAENLKDAEHVERNANARMRAAHTDMLEFLLDENYSINLVLVTNRRVDESAREYAKMQGSAPWTFDYDGRNYQKDVTMEVLDANELELGRERMIVASSPTPQVHLSIPENMYHEIPGQFRAAQATVLAQDVVEAYQKYRSGIFELNVRGPLGSNKVNKEIVKSLEYPVYRKNFHVLNNGITVLCRTFKYDKGSGTLFIDDFQVANGCQTTYTLYVCRDKMDESVWLKLTVVEGHSWAPIIAKSTNTQSSVRPEDFASLDRIHVILKQKFEQLEPPWLYEVRRGESRFATADQKQGEKSRFGNRKLTMREVAQSTLAFIGRPAMSKWSLNSLFDSQNEDGVNLYRKIFNEETSAEQLLLATLVARKVHDKVDDIVKKSTDTDMVGRLANVDWLPYARPFICGLIAEWLNFEGGHQKGFEALLPTDACRARLGAIDVWFEPAFNAGVEAVMYRMDVTTASEGSITYLREFFKNMNNYQMMVERLKSHMRGSMG